MWTRTRTPREPPKSLFIGFAICGECTVGEQKRQKTKVQSCTRSEAVKKLKTPEILAPKCLITKKCFLRFGDFFNFFTASQSRRVGRVCPQRAGPRSRKYGGALHNIGENLVFLRRFSGDTEQIAQTDDKGGRVSRSVWSAWSLLPLSDVWRGSKA